MEKMRAIGEHGQTVILVSHSLEAVTRLCDRVIHLDRGRIVADGPAQKVVAAYLHGGQNSWACRDWDNPSEAPGDPTIRLRRVRVLDRQEEPTETVDVREPFFVELEYDVLRVDHPIIPSVTIRNDHGVDVFESFDLDSRWRGLSRSPGRYCGVVRVPGHLLVEGTYYIGPGCFRQQPFHVHFYEPQAVAFHVVDPLEGGSARGDFSGQTRGIVRPLLKWTNRLIPTDDCDLTRLEGLES